MTSLRSESIRNVSRQFAVTNKLQVPLRFPVNLCAQSVQQDMLIGADPGELFMAYSRTQKHLQNPGVADCLVARSFPSDTA